MAHHGGDLGIRQEVGPLGLQLGVVAHRHGLPDHEQEHGDHGADDDDANPGRQLLESDLENEPANREDRQPGDRICPFDRLGWRRPVVSDTE